MNKTEMRISSQWVHWVGGVFQSTTKLAIKIYICQRIGLGANTKKLASTALNYLFLKGIPFYRVENNSLRDGGANAPLLAGYRNRHIKKMGRWRGETFKYYIREELHCFTEGMLMAMKQDFKFVNITRGSYREFSYVTRTTVVSDYQPATEGK